MKEGHTLGIPKKVVDYVLDLEDDTEEERIVVARKVAKAIELVVPCKRIGVAVIGLEVPHTHIHLVPIESVADINFASPKIVVSEERMKELASRIAEAYTKS